MADTKSNSLIKYAYTWVAIALTINLLFAGYGASQLLNFNTASEEDYYNNLILEDGPNSQYINELTERGEYDPNDIAGTSDDSQGAFSKFATLTNLGSGVSKVISFVVFSGYYSSIQIFKYQLNPFIAFFLSIFLVLGNVLFIFLIMRFFFARGGNT